MNQFDKQTININVNSLPLLKSLITDNWINEESGKLKLPEKGEFFFVPFEHLRDLILNQSEVFFKFSK